MCTRREDQHAQLGFWGVFSLLCEAHCLQGLQLTSDGKDARFRSRRRNMWETDSKWPALLGAALPLGQGFSLLVWPRAGLSPLSPLAERSSCRFSLLHSQPGAVLWSA